MYWKVNGECNMDERLRKLQLTQVEILKIIHSICREHDLHYSLYAGTLLGAVRHKGFIPWDDDLDVCMPREDYDRFIALWPTVGPEGYILQNKENTPAFTQSFTKIRKDHTTFLQEEWERGRYHTGIFVDIFPIDRLPNGKLQRAVFRWNCMKYQLFSREFVPPKGNLFVRLGARALLAVVPKKSRPKFRKKYLKRITKYSGNPKLQTVAIETMDTLFQVHPSDLMDEFTLLKFDTGSFIGIARWDVYLREKYGDYMQLPSENERIWTHHPILLSFEHNYEELP